MSVTTIENGVLPVAQYGDMLAQMAEEESEGIVVSMPSLRVKAVEFWDDEQKVGNSVCVYILAHRRVNAWYCNDFDPKNPESPECWSVFRHSDEAVAVPDPTSARPRGASCNACLSNVFGSDRKGRGGKDCSNSWRIMVVAAGCYDKDNVYIPYGPEEILEQTAYVVKVPTMSQKNVRTYVKKLGNGTLLKVGGKPYKAPTFAVATNISLKADPKAQFTMHFDFAHYVTDPEVMKVLFERHEEANQDIEYGFEPPVIVEGDAQPVKAVSAQSTRF